MLFQWSHSHMQHFFVVKNCMIKRGLEQKNCAIKKLHYLCHGTKQYLILEQLGGSLQAGDQDGKWEGELPYAPVSSGPFQLWDGMSAWSSVWRFASDIQSSKLLDLAAIDTIVVVMN